MKNKKKEFINECNKIISKMKSGKFLNYKNEKYANLTIKTYENIININIKSFEEHRNKKIFCKKINKKTINDFIVFLNSKNYAKNTVANILGITKFFLKKLYEKKITKYDGSNIYISSEKTTAIYTSIDELRILYKTKLSEGESRVRDIYICQCFLGLRFRDMFSFVRSFLLMTEKINDAYFFKIKTKKTGEIVYIPASKIVEKIIKNRNYNLGKPFTQQYYSDTLKKIYKKCGLEKIILYNRTEGGEKKEYQILNTKILGTHTARRTFATNAYLAGIAPLDIMSITGHKTFASFMKYIRCENKIVALKISKHNFFNLEL